MFSSENTMISMAMFNSKLEQKFPEGIIYIYIYIIIYIYIYRISQDHHGISWATAVVSSDGIVD